MSDETEIERMKKSVREQNEKFGSRNKVETDYRSNGKYTRGIQKALDSFYNTVSFKKGKAKRIGIDKRNRPYVIGRNGKRIKTKPYKRFISKLRRNV